MKMKKIISVVCCFIFVLLLSSCCKKTVQNDGKPVALAVIGGQHDNLVEYKEVDGNKILNNSSNFWNSDYRIQSVLGVVNDGYPEKADCKDVADKYKLTKKILDKDGILDSLIKKGKQTKLKQFAELYINLVSLKTADDEEVDTLKSFKVVSDYFKEYGDDVDKRIVVIDSGLSTKGALDFTDDAICEYLLNDEKDIDALVNELDENKEIPDLTGVKILWYGFGSAGDEKNQDEKVQDELTNLQKEQLKKIWKKILIKAGADVSDYDFKEIIEGKTITKADNLPKVTPVELVKPLTEEILGFEKGTAEFKKGTESKRKQVLKDYAELGKETKLLLVGTTSSDGRKGDSIGLKLSGERTDAVKSILVEKGVEDDSIKCLGLGIYSHMYDEDEFIDGEYDGDSEAAKRNRSVYIMDAECNSAERFYEDYEKLEW